MLQRAELTPKFKDSLGYKNNIGTRRISSKSDRHSAENSIIFQIEIKVWNGFPEEL